jgi:two-component system chemotaxis response regulator CheY
MKNILIVDDSPVMRAFIKRVLSVSGLDTGKPFEAGHGKQALELLRAHSMDLILSDINMPEMNGEEFLRAVRADEALSHIPVVVISTDASLGRVERMLGLGASGYITKPFTAERLRAELERVLEVANA